MNIERIIGVAPAVLALCAVSFLSGCEDPNAPLSAEQANAPLPMTSEPPEDAAAVTDEPPPVTVNYQCDNDLHVVATYQGQQVRLTIGEDQFELSQQIAASGALYRNDSLDWHTKGKDAFLTGADDTTHCSEE